MILLPMYCSEDSSFVVVVCFVGVYLVGFVLFFNTVLPLERILNNTALEHISQTKVSYHRYKQMTGYFCCNELASHKAFKIL